MVTLCSLLPGLFCPIIDLKNCYHGTQYSAGEDGRITTWKLVMFRVMLDNTGSPTNICWVSFPLLLQVCLLERQTWFKCNRTASLAQSSLGIPSVWGGGFVSLRSGQISEALQMQNLDREHNARMLINCSVLTLFLNLIYCLFTG